MKIKTNYAVLAAIWPCFWGCDSVAPGKAAAVSRAPIEGELVITEIMPNVDDAGGEWLELYNTSGAPIELAECRFSSATGDTFEVSGSVVIAPEAHIVVARDLDKAVMRGQWTSAVAYAKDSFDLSDESNQIGLTCNGVLIDEVEYLDYQPGPASGIRSWQLEPTATSASKNDDTRNWCYTPLVNLAGEDQVSTPGTHNPTCLHFLVPYSYNSSDEDVLIDGIDFDATLKVARDELARDWATAELTIWAIRDQTITPDVAQTISELYFSNIGKLYEAKPVTVIDWNHAVWHFAWAIANLYRNNDAQVKSALQSAYDDARTRPETLEKYRLIAIDNVMNDVITMGDIHERARKYGRTHIVVPGNPEFLQSYEEYMENRPGDLMILAANTWFRLRSFFGGLFT